MRAIIVLTAMVLSVPAGAQSVPAGTGPVMYIRPPLAVVCERLDLAKVAVAVASEAYRTGRAARSYPRGCWTVQPSRTVVLLDQFDDYAYVDIDAGRAQPAWSRAWVHVGALSDTPESAPRRRPR